MKKLRIDTLAAIGTNNSSCSICEEDFSLKAMQTMKMMLHLRFQSVLSMRGYGRNSVQWEMKREFVVS